MQSPEPTGKTLIKIRVTRKTREVWVLLKLLFWFAWTMACFAFVQCGLCQHHFPKRTVSECLAPRLVKK